jgi:hypothetical protein
VAEEERIVAVCGLDCAECPIRTADISRESAARLIGWWKNEGWIMGSERTDELMRRGRCCRGWRGGRKAHWSADGRILRGGRQGTDAPIGTPAGDEIRIRGGVKAPLALRRA